MPAPGTIRLVDPDGVIRDVDTEGAASALQDPRWRVASTDDELGRVAEQAKEASFGGAGGAVKAGAAAVARGATLGGSDVLARALGGEDTAIALEGLRDVNPGVSTGGEILGALAPALLTGGASAGASAGEIGAGLSARGLASRLPAAAVSRLGAGIARAGAEAGAVGKVGAAALGGAVEGGLYGAGQAVSNLSLSSDPLTVERVAQQLGSNVLFGAATGGLAGGGTKLAELGLGKAKGAIDAALERRAAKALTTDEAIASGDLELLDTSKLKAARAQEMADIHAARLPERTKIVDDLKAYRDAMWNDKLTKAHYGIPDGGIREAGGSLKTAERQIRKLLDKEVVLAKDPARALEALQQQEQAMTRLHDWAAPQLEKNASRDLTAESLADLQADAMDAARSAESQIPTYQRLKGQPESPVTTIPSSEIQKRGWYEPTGQGADAVKADNARAAIRAGQRDPIAIVVGDDGKLFVHDGRNRLNAAIEQGAPVKVKWDYGTVSGDGDVFKGGSAAGGEPIAPPIRRVPEEIGPFTPAGMQVAAEREAQRRSSALAPHLKRLDNIDLIFPGAIERNRALQKRITDLALPPTSERLTKIDDALEHLGAPKAPSFGDAVVGFAAPFAGPLGVAAVAGGKMLGKFRELAAAAGERAGKSASSFLAVAERGARKAGPGAAAVAAIAGGAARRETSSAVLGRLRYADDTATPARPGARGKVDAPALTAAYKARTAEIRSQTAYDETGVPRLRPEARAKMAARIDPIRHVDPVLADRIETAAARRIEYLSSIMPRHLETGGVQIGPDRRQPSDAEMRSWARSARAVEDPHGVLERATHGQITPEDAAAMRALHPAELAAFTSHVSANLGTLRKTLPAHRRLALYILTGVPVDAAHVPATMRVIQAMYSSEPGTDGGTQAPRAAPQFGSVKAAPATPAEQRQAGGLQ